jgi:uncharacterized protein YgfB (UPF0149 family)
LPSWDEVEREAARLSLSTSAAELHGALSGWLAAGGKDQPGWIAEVMADPALPVPLAGDSLDRLRTTTVAQLGDADFGFDLLLPEGDDGLVADRAGALFAWCRAFLGGFGLAIGDTALSEEDQEALADIANLAAARIDEVDPDSDEESLVEIEEYLRMAVLLLHADCALAPRQRNRLH